MTERPTRRQIIEQFIPNSPRAAQLGIRVDSIGTDEAVLELPFRPELATIGRSRARRRNRRPGRHGPDGTVIAHGIATYRFG